jgi:hypothetical protein
MYQGSGLSGVSVVSVVSVWCDCSDADSDAGVDFAPSDNVELSSELDRDIIRFCL